MNNPFVTKGYAGPDYFCDRVKETEDLVKLLTNENNMALISPRRIGKTDLIHHCFAQPSIQKHYYTFIIDIYATNSLADFVEVFGRVIFDTLKPLGRKVWEGFFNTIKSIQQQISFDINGNPVWGLGLGASANPSTTLDEIFNYLNSAGKPCMVAIDEFQRITDYPDGQNVEAALRTHIQRCTNTTFLFCGSKRHLMTEIFLSPSRPFYQSVITMGLNPISEEKYTAFAQQLFKKNGKSIDREAVQQVYDRFDGQLSAKEIMDLMNETENLAPIAYFQKQLFLVDTQIFTNCFIFEVAFKGISTNLDFFAFEAIAAAEMVWVCDRIREFYGRRAK